MVIRYNKNDDNSNSNLKYISRCQYYGKLQDYEYVTGAMVLKFIVYTATEYFGGSSIVRVYVPTDLEEDLRRNLIVGENYLVITAPYRINFNKQYRHRVDLLINIFQEVI